jgi:hypothetical protein
MFVKKVLSAEGMGGTAHLQSLCHAESRAIFHHGNSIKGIPLCSLYLPVRFVPPAAKFSAYHSQILPAASRERLQHSGIGD